MRVTLLCLNRQSSAFWRYTPAGKAKPWSAAYANLPERYRLRKSHKLVERSPRGGGFVPTLKFAKIYEYDLDRSWSQEFANRNRDYRGKAPPVVQPIRDKDWMWFKGDRVELLTGPDKGKQGFINYVVQERNWVCVEGLNGEYATMGDDDHYPGYMYLDEKPLLVTDDIKLVDPSSEMASEVEWRFTEEGERVRVCVESGHVLPVPTEAYETVDYKTPKAYKENDKKDTPARLVEEVTFTPKLATFEMDIMRQMGIKEERTGTKTYWY